MRRAGQVFTIGAALLACSAAAGHAQNSGTTDGERSVLRGVYTKSQSAKGRDTFLNICASCHSPGQFSGETFQRTWAGRTVGELFARISTTMPGDNPGGLTPREYAAVIAYFLELNGYPTGEADLPTATAALRKIRFEAAISGH